MEVQHSGKLGQTQMKKLTHTVPREAVGCTIQAAQDRKTETLAQYMLFAAGRGFLGSTIVHSPCSRGSVPVY